MRAVVLVSMLIGCGSIAAKQPDAADSPPGSEAGQCGARGEACCAGACDPRSACDGTACIAADVWSSSMDGTFDFNEKNPEKGFAPIIEYLPFTAVQNAPGGNVASPFGAPRPAVGSISTVPTGTKTSPEHRRQQDSNAVAGGSMDIWPSAQPLLALRRNGLARRHAAADQQRAMARVS
jgi:hypothetical protein